MEKWKTISSEEVVHNNWITLRKNKVSLPNGVVINDFYTVDISDASSVVAVDVKGNVVLKKEYRYCQGKETIEIPAGAFEKGEEPLEVAKRELLEETGYASDEWRYLGDTMDSPAKLTNHMHLFLATNCRKIDEQQLDKTEQIEVLIVPFEQAIQMVMDNRISSNSSASALLRAARLLKK